LVSTSPTNYHGPNTQRKLWKRTRQRIFPPQGTEKICHGSLQLHHREHPDRLITAWYGICSVSDHEALQWVVHTA
jgi:hypothetical protein